MSDYKENRSKSNDEIAIYIQFNLALHVIDNPDCSEFFDYIKSNHIDEFIQQYHDKKIRKKYITNSNI